MSDISITPKRRLKSHSLLKLNDLKNGYRAPKTSSVTFHKTVLNQLNEQKNINKALIEFSNETTDNLFQQQQNQVKIKNKSTLNETHLRINAKNTEYFF